MLADRLMSSLRATLDRSRKECELAYRLAKHQAPVPRRIADERICVCGGRVLSADCKC